MAEKSDIVKCLTVLASKIPNAKPNDALLRGYIESFQHVPIEVLEVALAQGLMTWKFFPSIAEIFDHVHPLTSAASVLPTPGEAWGIVVQAIQKVGFYGNPHFDCELVAKTVDNMGWAYLCTSEEQMADRAHFMKMYEQLKRRAEQDSKLLPRSLEMRENMRIKSMDNGEPKRLKPAFVKPIPAQIPPPAEVLDILKLISEKLALVPNDKPPAKPEPPVEVYIKMQCDTCSRKVDSRMGWNLGELCNIPKGENLYCTGRMIEA